MSQEVENAPIVGRHDAYKALISLIAEKLSAEDLRSLEWHVDAPPKLRTGSALDLLENLQRQGKFSEQVVGNLSELMKKINRMDLMERVDQYKCQYARHFSVPSRAVHPPPSLQPQRSYSMGNHERQTSAPPLEIHQESCGEPPELPSNLVYQRSNPHIGNARARSVMSSTSINSFQSHNLEPSSSNSGQSSSLDTMANSRFSDGRRPSQSAVNVVSPNLDHQLSSGPDNHSLSNSGSIHFNYNSYPSSHAASQEAFRPEPMSLLSNDASIYNESVSHYNGAEYIPRPPPSYGSHLSYPWYRQASLSSIPQEELPYHPHHHPLGPFNPRDPRLIPAQHYQPHISMNEVQPHSTSQDSLSSAYYVSRYGYQYPQTPPHARRVSFNHSKRVPPRRHQSISGYPIANGERFYNHSGKFSQSMPAAGIEQATGYMEEEEEIRQGWENIPPNTSTPKAAKFKSQPVLLESKSVQTNRVDINKLSPQDYKSASTHMQTIINNSIGTIKEQDASPIGSVEMRRRANSLKQDSDYKTQSTKRTNRHSFISVDERHPRKELQLLPSNAMQRSASTGNADGNSTNEIISPSDSIATRLSKGSAVHSTSTLNSEESHCVGITASKARMSPNNGTRPPRRKETLLTKLTLQFSRVVKPRKEIEWHIKRSKLNKVIYEQTDKYMTCPFKMELDSGSGGSHPKLILYVHPYGVEEDSNKNVTLEVAIEVAARPKIQRLHSSAEVEVRVRAEDKDKKEVFGKCRTVRESMRFKYFFIKGFIGHHELKQSHSDYVVFIISANLITPTST